MTIAIVMGVTANVFRSDAYRLAWVGNYGRSLTAPPQPKASIARESTLPSETEIQGGSPSSGARQTAESSVPNGKSGEKAVVSPVTHSPGRSLRDVTPPKDPGLLFLEISGEVARRMQKAGALFLDARRSSLYEAGHIPGAVSVAVWEHDADAKVEKLRQSGMPIDQIIVAYCSGGSCKDAEVLTEKLSAAGFFNVYLYQDGYPDWQARNWPVNRGKKP